jgi:hypothetical protein
MLSMNLDKSEKRGGTAKRLSHLFFYTVANQETC